MKKMNLVFILCFVLLLAACNRQNVNSEMIIEDETFLIENIRFEKKQIYIDTEAETLVYFPSEVEFFKTNETSYINLKVVEKRNEFQKNLITGEYPKEKTIAVYIDKGSVKDVSKNYAQEFNKTLSFIKSSDDSE